MGKLCYVNVVTKNAFAKTKSLIKQKQLETIRRKHGSGFKPWFMVLHNIGDVK